MPLATGTRLGAYEILGPLGADCWKANPCGCAFCKAR